MKMRTGKAGLGLFQLFTVLFGSIIGVAWIVATGMWIGQAGPIGALLAFGVGALIMSLIGLCFAEMMTLFPDANGSMAYVFEAFGERASAVAGWFLVLTYAATCAWYFVTLGWLVQAVLPWTNDLVLGVLGAVVITLVNIRGVSARAMFQDALVITKMVVGLGLFLCAAFLGRSERLQPLFAGSTPREAWTGVAAVAAMTPFFFSGFDVLPQAVRDRRPGTQLRRVGTVVVLATVAAFVFYGGAILSATVSLDRPSLREASLPVVAAFSVGLGRPVFGTLIVVCGISGVLSGWNANLLSGARVLQGMAKAGATLSFFARESSVHAHGPGVPLRTTLLISAISVALGMLGRNALSPIVDIATVPLLVVFVLVCAGLIKLRRTRSTADRPYRVPGGLVVPLLALALSIGLVFTAIVAAYAAVGGILPIGFMLLWCATGWLFWIRSASSRLALSTEQRKRLVLECVS
ncbi:MAG: APC family permease [Proteobacteria bacterium]|nr:APC family permease [Pseudomonadota bacterium]